MMEQQWPTCLRSKELKDKISNAKVLCVGAGGIGCELLKTLVCTGFKNIEVIDLDTIETSNLNRQFLFRKHHVGESKARTAAAVVKTFKPDASIVAHHANVKEPRFGVDYITGFDLVLNGLDNLEARRHVNRLVMAAGKPLVESGTAGYLGQVTVHMKGETECFECTPKPTPKTYPICTLRNTPDKPIHCVVWAKDLLFARLFGKPEAITDLDDVSKAMPGPDPSDPALANGEQRKTDNSTAGDKEEDSSPAQQEAAARAAAEEEASAFIKRDDETPLAYAVRIFNHMYTSDIRRLADHSKQTMMMSASIDLMLFLSSSIRSRLLATQPVSPLLQAYDMIIFWTTNTVFPYLLCIASSAAWEDLWKTRSPPQPLVLDELFPGGENALDASLALNDMTAAVTPCKALGLKDSNAVWSTADNAKVFLRSVVHYYTQRQDELGSAEFDKDDDLAVEFVTSASNLRAACYGIPTQSLFAAKGMAGNIIHAIATTNAMVSGLIVGEALKLLAGCKSAVHTSYLNEVPSGKRLVGASNSEKPKPDCMVCGRATLTLHCNIHMMTLGQLVQAVCKKRLAVVTPMLMSGDFMYEEGEGLDEDEVDAYKMMLTRPLSQLPGGGLKSGSLLHLSDEAQAFNVDLAVIHQDEFTPEEAPEGFILQGTVPEVKSEAQQEAAQETAAAAVQPAQKPPQVKETDDGALELLDDDEPSQRTTQTDLQQKGRGKRSRDEESEDNANKSKQAKLEATGNDADVVILD